MLDKRYLDETLDGNDDDLIFAGMAQQKSLLQSEENGKT